MVSYKIEVGNTRGMPVNLHWPSTLNFEAERFQATRANKLVSNEGKLTGRSQL